MKGIIPPLFDSRARPQVSIYVATEPTLLVVPTFNESSNIGELIERFFPNLLLLRRTGEKGLGRAYLAGISTGLEKQFQIIGTMDADLSHDPAYLPLMLTMIESADVVIGSRYIRDGGTINWQIRRVLLSWLANKYAAKLLRIPAHDLTSGYRLYRRGTIERLQLKSMKSTGYSFLVELLYRAHATGAKIAESPIVFYDRTMGASKLRSREIYIGALNLFLLRLLKKT